MQIRKFKSKVKSTKNLSSTVKSIELKVPTDFEFLAGQYISVIFERDGKKIARPYSIASSPTEKGIIELCIKRVENGPASNYLWNLEKNAEIEIMGPLGNFTLKEFTKNKPLAFICVGTGLAPFRSMISQLISGKSNKKIILIKGARYEEDILYKDEFTSLAEKNLNLKVYDILSQPKNNSFQDKGYVQNYLEKYIPKNFDGNFYICGLKIMIFAVEKKLLEMGFRKEQIFFEKYD